MKTNSDSILSVSRLIQVVRPSQEMRLLHNIVIYIQERESSWITSPISFKHVSMPSDVTNLSGFVDSKVLWLSQLSSLFHHPPRFLDHFSHLNHLTGSATQKVDSSIWLSYECDGCTRIPCITNIPQVLILRSSPTVRCRTRRHHMIGVMGQDGASITVTVPPIPPKIGLFTALIRSLRENGTDQLSMPPEIVISASGIFEVSYSDYSTGFWIL